MDSEINAGPFSEDVSGETFCICVGFSIGLIRLEFEHIDINEDIDFVK